MAGGPLQRDVLCFSCGCHQFTARIQSARFCVVRPSSFVSQRRRQIEELRRFQQESSSDSDSDDSQEPSAQAIRVKRPNRARTASRPERARDARVEPAPAVKQKAAAATATHVVPDEHLRFREKMEAELLRQKLAGGGNGSKGRGRSGPSSRRKHQRPSATHKPLKASRGNSHLPRACPVQQCGALSQFLLWL